MTIHRLFRRIWSGLASNLWLLIAMRWVVLAGVSLRFLVTHSQYQAPITQWWMIALVALLAYTLGITVLTVGKPDLQQATWWHRFQVLTDTLIVSALYWLTRSPDSDLYLLYFVPLVTAAEYFAARQVLPLFAMISTAFVLVTVSLALPPPTDTSAVDNLVRNLLPRGTFFLYMLFVVLMRDTLLKEQAEELEVVHATAMKIGRNESLQSRLEGVLEAAIDLVKAERCEVYLRVPGQDQLELVAFKGVKYSGEPRADYVIPFSKGLAGEIIIRGTSREVGNDNFPSRALGSEDLSAVGTGASLATDESIGFLRVFDARPPKIGDRGLRLLERLAQYAAMTIHDMQLFENAQMQAETLEVLNAASRAMNADLKFENTVHSATEYVWRLAGIHAKKPPLFACLGSLHNGHLKFEAAYPECHLDELQTRVGQIDLRSQPVGIVGRTVRTGSSQLVSDVTRDPDYIAYNPHTRSQLAVPVRIGDNIRGVISVEHTDKEAFPPSLLRNVEVLAAQAAIAIEHAELFTEIETRREQAERLHEASVAMSSARGLDSVGRSILEHLQSIVPFSRATLHILQGDKRELVAKYNLGDDQIHRYLPRDELIREIVEHKEIYILPSLEDHPSWRSRATTSDIMSWIGIPLVYGDTVVGLITIGRVEGDPYGEGQREPLQLFARLASSVLQNAILSRVDTELIRELSETKDDLQDALEYLQDQRNLAIIGLVYGESIHHAKNQLGMAKTRAANIVQGYYDYDVDELKRYASGIIDYINNYLRVLDETQVPVLPLPTKIDLHALLDGVIRSKRISPDIRVVREYKAAPITNAPQQQLRQVFFVIVQNALDAMNGEGTLGLETQSVRVDDTDSVQVSISDTGTGIPKKEQERLFKMSSARRRARGSGMGLAWARSFMRSYGGDIWFETSRGRGTTMHIRLPTEFRSSMVVEQGSDQE